MDSQYEATHHTDHATPAPAALTAHAIPIPLAALAQSLAHPGHTGRGNGPVQVARMLHLQRTVGNRATRRLMPQAAPAVQRVVSISGRIANPPADDEYDDLDDLQRTAVDNMIDDRTQQFDFPSKADLYAFAAGDTTKAPTITAITAQDLKKAKKRKNREAFNHNTETESTLTDIKGFHALPKGQLPVWNLMGGPDNLVFTHNPHTKQHELRSRKSGKSTQNTARKNQTSLTTYEEQGSGKVHWHANVGSDLASSYTDTDITSGPGSGRDSAMGGFDNKNNDFHDAATDETMIIGHSSAYKDTIQQIKKKQKTGLNTAKITDVVSPQTTDEDPLAFTPEQNDLGLHGRRTQLETKMRGKSGRYMEANELGSSTRMVNAGRKIPESKHYMRMDQTGGFDSYAKFDQNADIKGEKDTAGGWNKYWDQQATGNTAKDFPQEEYYESSDDEDWPMAMHEPSTPNYLDSFREEDRYFSKTPLTLGSEVTHKGKTWTVVAETSNTTAGIEYLIARTNEED